MMSSIKHSVKQTLIILAANFIDKLERNTISLRNKEIISKLKFCGSSVDLRGRVQINNPENISIASNVYVGPNTLLAGMGGITIGENTSIGLNTVVLSASHDYKSEGLPYAQDAYVFKPVSIGKNVWIGANVVIVPGTKVGDGAIIAAGTVVSGEVKPLSIVANQPFRVIGYRDKEHYERFDSKESQKLNYQ